MALDGQERALLTARVGVARVGASRCSYAPTRTDDNSPGGSGARPVWDEVALPAGSWTAVTTT